MLNLQVNEKEPTVNDMAKHAVSVTAALGASTYSDAIVEAFEAAIRASQPVVDVMCRCWEDGSDACPVHYA